ncbi:hypothetical protein NLJ89_g9918 [Agrocybe chaxingu]|uniref:Transcription factor TFIIIC triple barrel domain-containing protein n=1 Tax=Agrocybe chaxingu TaxID=84603 RepID=A0A9W8JRK0_9AGAR|nr:hypothetical protein NLJ89_g9918 [Agrocybe chaxingu]
MHKSTQGLDTPTPFLQLQGTILQGRHDLLLGTELLFTDDKDTHGSKRSVSHVGTTEQRIAFQEVTLTPKKPPGPEIIVDFVTPPAEDLDQKIDRMTGLSAPPTRGARKKTGPNAKGKEKAAPGKSTRGEEGKGQREGRRSLLPPPPPPPLPEGIRMDEGASGGDDDDDIDFISVASATFLTVRQTNLVALLRAAKTALIICTFPSLTVKTGSKFKHDKFAEKEDCHGGHHPANTLMFSALFLPVYLSLSTPFFPVRLLFSTPFFPVCLLFLAPFLPVCLSLSTPFFPVHLASLALFFSFHLTLLAAFLSVCVPPLSICPTLFSVCLALPALHFSVRLILLALLLSVRLALVSHPSQHVLNKFLL